MKFLLAGVIDSISDYLVEFINNFSITLDTVFYIGIGFQTLMVIFYLIKSHYAYEGRLERTLDKLSRWLYYHKTIDSSNLIEFNNMMKKTPKLLRHHWQQYMLYRENPPSHYMSTYNCIEKPLHTSSYSANLKNLMNINIAIIFVTFVFGFTIVGGSLDAGAMLKSAIVPMIICILNTLFIMLLRSMQNFNLSSLYFNFSMFQRYVDKASVTLPEYVDFEVLFTKKEIARGIPVLNEYLEKRARQEQEELEKARLNAVEHEKYDFSESGMNGSLLLDRAIKETEVYLNARQRILYEIGQLESEMDSFKRNYENTSKEYQRKMQASKENVERLRKQQEETTNRIESNYIKKQQGDEIKKQETLEKEQEDATVRFNQQVTSLQSEIDKRKIDLDERKLYVQTSMLSEYQTFSNKLYDEILESIQAKHDQEKQEISDEKDELTLVLADKNTIIESQNREIEDLKSVIVNAGIEAGDHGRYYSQELLKEEQRVRLGIENNPDQQVDYYAEYAEPVQEYQYEPVEEQALVEEAPVEVQEQAQEEVQVDEYGGYYDENGYYWYPNGTYYDNEGYYHDENGDVYDPEGNFIRSGNEDGAEVLAPQEEVAVEQTQEEVAQENLEEEKLEEKAEEKVEEKLEQNILEEKKDEELASIEETLDKWLEEEAKEENLEEESDILLDFGLDEEVKEEPKVEEQVEEAPKRKRGRPKGSTKNKLISVGEPKKRGRPRKEKTEEVEEKPKAKRGRPKKVQEVVEEKPKAKRGRPKKVQEEVVEEKPKAKRGRPKGSTVNKKISLNKEPKKAGRPKKAQAEVVEEKPKAKRGRPKGSTVNKKISLNKEPKKAGRPKKEASQVEEAPKKKRGRPKGSTKAVAEELKLLNAQIQEEQRKLLEEQKQLNKQLSETINKIDIDKNKEAENPEGENKE